MQSPVPVQGQPVVGVTPSAPEVGSLASDAPVVATGGQVETLVPGSGKGKKANKCWKCAVDTHSTKSCPVKHYCLVCDNGAHPTLRCPTLRLPKPTAFSAGYGTEETIFFATA